VFACQAADHTAADPDDVDERGLCERLHPVGGELSSLDPASCNCNILSILTDDAMKPHLCAGEKDSSIHRIKSGKSTKITC